MNKNIWGISILLVLGALLGEISAWALPDVPGTAVPVPTEESDLFTGVEASESAAAAAAEPWLLRRRLVEVDLAQLGWPGPGEQGMGGQPPPPQMLTLNLFDDVLLPVELLHVEQNGERGYSWIGRVQGSDFSLVALTVGDGVLTGAISTPFEQYEIGYLGGGVHIIREIDGDQRPPDAPPLVVEGETSANLNAPAQTPENEEPVIDILVVYTKDARIAAGGTAAIESEIDNHIAFTNQTYANSGLKQRLHLAHAAEVDYVQGDDLEEDLVRLQNPVDGPLDEVHALRDETFADDVLLIVKDVRLYCGIANLMTTLSYDFESEAFAVMARRCGSLTFAHELGHISGASHDRYIPTWKGIFPYSYGYVYGAATQDGWRTIMAYVDECRDKGGVCPQLPYWSNPDVTYEGVPMGVPEGDPLAADNRKTLNNTASTVANFRDPARDGHIKGTVADETDGRKLAGIQVKLYLAQHNGGIPEEIARQNSGAAGQYDFGNLAAGAYRLGFNDRSQVYLPEYYDNKPDFFSADDIAVTADTTVTIDVALTASGGLAGTVVEQGVGTPIKDIAVAVFMFNTTSGSWEREGGGTYSDADGKFVIRGLESGTYRLHFEDGSGVYVNEYYNDAWDLESATDIQVTRGETATVDMAMARGGAIRGTVTSAAGGYRLEWVRVNVYFLQDEQWILAKDFGTSAYSDEEGLYEKKGLKAGYYRVEFADTAYYLYQKEYYDGAHDWNQATAVRVYAGKVTDKIDASLDRLDAPTATPTRTPTTTPTRTPTKTPTYTPTATGTGVQTPAATPTFTPTAAGSGSPTPTATATVLSPATDTPAFTATPSPHAKVWIPLLLYR